MNFPEILIAQSLNKLPGGLDVDIVASPTYIDARILILHAPPDVYEVPGNLPCKGT